MAYTIPNLALLFNDADVEEILNLEPGTLDFEGYDMSPYYEAAEQLNKLFASELKPRKLYVNSYGLESGECPGLGITIVRDFIFHLEDSMLKKADKIRKESSHELIKNSKLGIASEFC